ncbi:MAG: hypothetical protein WEF28_10700 [Acidimicrobiia bacterium]
MTIAASRSGMEGAELVEWKRPRFSRWIVFFGLGVIVTYAASTILDLSIPAPTGDHAVGRESWVWVDDSRPESHTPGTDDMRSVPVRAWYPAQPGTGQPASYVEDLAVIEAGLEASGELSWLETLGLRMVRHHALQGAEVAASDEGFPVLLLSPGNATNVGFYSALAEDLASKGYVVIGIDHAFQVAAVRVGDGSVAVYDQTMDTGPESIRPKIEERVADMAFVLEQIREGTGGIEFLAPSLDLSRIGVLGHSNAVYRRPKCVELKSLSPPVSTSTDRRRAVPSDTSKMRQPPISHSCSSPKKPPSMTRSTADSKPQGQGQ